MKDKTAVVNTLKELFEQDRDVDAIFVEFIDKHVDLKPMVKKCVDGLDREWWKSFAKKGAVVVGGIILALISGLAGYFLPHHP